MSTATTGRRQQERELAEKLQRVRASPAYFRSIVNVEVNNEARPLRDVIAPFQQRDFEALDNAWRRMVGQPVDPGITQGWFERGRGLSKSSDAAISSVWAMIAAPSLRTGVVCAADKEQAGEVRKAVQRFLEVNPWLHHLLEVQADRVLNPETGTELQILASDALTSYGKVIDWCVVDEVSHHKSHELYESMMSATVKRDIVVVMVCTNAGFIPSWQYNRREAARQDPDWHFSSVKSAEASWMTPARLAKMRKNLVSDLAYRRVCENEWIHGGGDAISPSDLEAAIKCYDRSAPLGEGWALFGGLDIGVHHDATAFAIVAKHVGHWREIPQPDQPPPTLLQRLGVVDAPPENEPQREFVPGTGRLKLVDLRTWKPTEGRPVPLAEVEAYILHQYRRRHFMLGIDPSQGVLISQNLQKVGVWAELLPSNPQNLKAFCEELLRAMADRNIDIYPDADLVTDLRSLGVEENRNGVRLVSRRIAKMAAGQPGTPHGDTVSSLTCAMLMARKHGGQAHSRTIDRPLLSWP